MKVAEIKVGDDQDLDMYFVHLDRKEGLGFQNVVEEEAAGLGDKLDVCKKEREELKMTPQLLT